MSASSLDRRRPRRPAPANAGETPVQTYLAGLSADKRATLEKVRKAIRAAAPDAKEGMSYGVPAFIQGKPIAGYSASATHCSYFPMSGSVTAQLADDLQGYEVSKGGLRFPIGKPPPATLIRKLVKARLAEIEAPAPKKASAKKSAKEAVSGDVEALVRGLKHPLKKEIEAVRLIILGASPAITDGVKWNAPSFRTNKDWFATINLRAKDSVQAILHRGAKARPDQKAFKLADPKGLITWLGEDRALVTLGAGGDIPQNRKALEAIVRAWIRHI
jgi:uncharacterized protein YdhG (YjbR/CyaY superfamily)